MVRRAILLMLLVLAGGLGAAEGTILQHGEYEVSVRLELPAIEDMGASKQARVCVAADGSGTHGLAVLSDNNPLARCPASNVWRDGDTLTFDIVCPGGNQAVASARYTLSGQRFTGVITMKMGGKNMTMTERQSGRRVGACPPRS